MIPDLCLKSSIVLTRRSHRTEVRALSVLVAALLLAIQSAPGQGLPSGWSSQDIGSPAQAGSASMVTNTGVWTVSGGGLDVWGTSDQFHFASKDWNGNGSLLTCVSSVQNTDSSAKAGVMFRDSTAANSAFAFVFVTAGNGVWFQYRNSNGAGAATFASFSGTAPIWVKLVRSGSDFTGYYSANGLNWTTIGSTSISMAATAKAGLAVCAHNNAALCASTFGSVAVVANTNSATSSLQRLNLAKFQAASASSTASGKPAAFVTDGRVGNDSAWQSSGGGAQWVAVTLPVAMPVGSAQIYLGSDDTSPVSTFSLQYFTGSSWIIVPGMLFSGNTSTVINATFSSPVTASQFRLSSNGSMLVRELALFGTNNPSGYPIGTDVTLNVAKSRPVTASSTDGIHYAKGAVDGFAGEDFGGWQTADVTGSHTLDVDLLTTTRIGSAHIYSGSALLPAAANFKLQSWTGSAWVDIAGSLVGGNTQKERIVTFSAPVSTSKVRLVLLSNGAQAIRELAVFAASTGITSYPVGTDVVTNNPPTTTWEEFSDAFYQIDNLNNSNVLVADGSGVTVVAGNPEDLGQQFQFLYNYDSDTFRIRNRQTWQCLAAEDAGVAVGTAVAETDYSAMPHQLWRLEFLGDNDYRIVNVWNGLVLEADEPSAGLVTLQSASSSQSQQWRLSYVTHYPKKGLADYNQDWDQSGLGWVYNWGMDPSAGYPASLAYAPMAWGGANVPSLPVYYSTWHAEDKPIVLAGYNEPDMDGSVGGSNMSVSEGVSLWPQLEAMNLPLVSPGPASKDGGWLADFYGQVNVSGRRVDYTALHIYGGLQVDSLFPWLESAYQQWGRPVWFTEFGIAYVTWSEETMYRFLAEFMWRAEGADWLRRYSIFPFYDGQDGNVAANPWDNQPRSYLFYADPGHTRTALGELYAAWDGDRVIRTNTAYLLHNKAASFRIGNSGGSTPITGNIRVSDSTLQWTLAPASVAGRWYLVSVQDGKRLRWTGGVLDLASAGTTGSAVEWTYTADTSDEYGYFFIDNPATGQRLQMNRTPSSGAPASVTMSMVSSATVNDNTRWRFIKPVNPATLGVPTGLNAAAGDEQVTLTWTAATAATGYHVKRSTTNSGSYTLIASTAMPSYIDAGLTNGVTYYYAVSATNSQGESVDSEQASATPTSSVTSSNTLLFLDTFTVSANSWDVNFEYDAVGRQSGTLGPLTYTQVPATGAGVDGFEYTHQVGHSENTGALKLLAVGYSWDAQGRVSPDYNFNVAGTTRISLDVIPGTTDWQAINLGAGSSGRNLGILDGGSAFGILFKPGGIYETFNGGSGLGSGTYSATPGTNSILIEISDTDGNPWDGVGATIIDCYADGSFIPFFSYTNSSGYTDNYITLQAFGNYGSGFVDNLSVSVLTASPPAQPLISSVSLSGAELIFSGTNGVPNGSYHLLWSTSVTLPLSEWERIATNQFDGSGYFNVTEPVDPARPQSYYRLEIP